MPHTGFPVSVFVSHRQHPASPLLCTLWFWRRRRLEIALNLHGRTLSPFLPTCLALPPKARKFLLPLLCIFPLPFFRALSLAITITAKREGGSGGSGDATKQFPQKKGKKVSTSPLPFLKRSHSLLHPAAKMQRPPNYHFPSAASACFHQIPVINIPFSKEGNIAASCCSHSASAAAA